jgi:hypothetical protein
MKGSGKFAESPEKYRLSGGFHAMATARKKTARIAMTRDPGGVVSIIWMTREATTSGSARHPVFGLARGANRYDHARNQNLRKT